MRLLIVAPGANRDAVGETQNAYQWITRLSELHDVTLLTDHPAGRPLAPQFPNARVVEWPEMATFHRFERFNAMLKPGYPVFARRARSWIRNALKQGERFDVAHQLIPVSMRYPSPLAGAGIPYVIGPVGGSLSSPPAFASEEGGAQWFTVLRRLDGLRLRFDPALRKTYLNAAAVLGIAEYTRELLGEMSLKDFKILSEVGIDSLPSPETHSARTEQVRFLFVGRVIRTKGVRDAIRGLAKLPRGLAVLDIVGTGYDEAECKALARELNVDDCVTFHGWVSHDQVDGFYRRSDAFVFPSYREAGGIAIVEALSHGLPAIVCDRGGPAATVDDSCALKVHAETPEQYAESIAVAMRTLALDPQLRAEMGAAARRRLEAIALWSSRIAWMNDVYDGIAAVAKN